MKVPKIIRRLTCKHESRQYFRCYTAKLINGKYEVHDLAICDNCGKVVYDKAKHVYN